MERNSLVTNPKIVLRKRIKFPSIAMRTVTNGLATVVEFFDNILEYRLRKLGRTVDSLHYLKFFFSYV